MAAKLKPAKAVAHERADGTVWIDHAEVSGEDLNWLRDVGSLILWNVRLPDGFLSCLPRLSALDLRGGSGETLNLLYGVGGLEYLAVNQVRGLRDASALSSLSSLRLLSLYGLPRLHHLPSLSGLPLLQRAELGMLGSLSSLLPVLDAPQLSELLLLKDIPVSPVDVQRINAHPTMKMFDWIADDVPQRKSAPVRSQVTLAKVKPLFPEEWLRLNPPDGRSQ